MLIQGRRDQCLTGRETERRHREQASACPIYSLACRVRIFGSEDPSRFAFQMSEEIVYARSAEEPLHFDPVIGLTLADEPGRRQAVCPSRAA
jgi:hypothetical protein